MVRSETCSFSASRRAVVRRPTRRNCTIRNRRSARRMRLSVGMEPDGIALGVYYTGGAAHARRQLDHVEDLATGFGHAKQHFIEYAVGVQVDDGAGLSRDEFLFIEHAARDGRFFVV